jgi:ABC-type multidrug transport system ATPase subunit
MDHGIIVKQGTVTSLVATPDTYEIRVKPESVSAAAALLGVQAIGDDVEVNYHTIEELNGAIDKLRAGAILIESIQQKRSSLEDLFIKLIGTSDLTKS